MFSPIGRIFSEAKNRAVILRYHRVAELETDPQKLAVTPPNFAAHLQTITDQYHPITLRELGECMRDGSVPDRSVVLTLDGGYVDTLYETKPLLQHFGIPATVFVSAGRVGEKTEFWWDDLERLLLHANGMRGELAVEVNGKTYEWKIDGGQESNAFIRTIHESWSLADRHTPTQRHAAYRKLQKLMKTLSHDEQREVIEQLNDAAGLPAEGRPSHRALDRLELKELAQSNMIEIGASGLRYCRLAGLSLSKQRSEIASGKELLESLIERPVTSFAYPYGRVLDHDETSMALVHDAGFEQACAAVPGVVTMGRFNGQSINQYELPRHNVRDWDGVRFEHELHGMFAAESTVHRRAA